jgi:hypothetical protein
MSLSYIQYAPYTHLTYCQRTSGVMVTLVVESFRPMALAEPGGAAGTGTSTPGLGVDFVLDF